MVRPDLPAGRLALLLTDIEGSTRLLHRLGSEGYARAQGVHRHLLRDAFGRFGGVEVDTQGDAFFYVFPAPRDCLLAAITGTRALARHDWPHGEEVKVRMGMHCGEPQPTEEGYVGMVVNTAARVAAIGHGGQILLSAEAAAEVNGDLEAAGVTVRDLGHHRLKDLEEPQHLYQAVIPGLPADFPPPRSAALRPHNLPAPLTPFIGRDRLVAELRDMILDFRCRAVTLLGPGGTGKSRLALETARELLHSFEDGAWFVGLAAIREPDQVLPAIATALAVKEEAGRELRATLAEHLATQRLLLVLDNFEQVPGAARGVAELLAVCPFVKVLVTSRQPLRIKGERRVPVPPMALPAPHASLADIAESEAVRLFVETAEEACWDFELDAGNAADVVEICRRVDALPLAIELATSKLATMSVAELLAALQDRLDTLTDGSVDLLDHQQTLRDLIAWSYDLLDPREQRLWRRLAVFSGGASLPAVAEVCDPDGEYAFPRDIDNLVTKSLVNLEFSRRSGPQGNAGKRIVMLETLREFAAEQLAETDEAAGIAARHSRRYRNLAEEAAGNLRGAETTQWLERLDDDFSNLRQALLHGFSPAGDPEEAAAIAGSMWFYFYERGLLSEGRGWLEKAVAVSVPAPVAARALLGLAVLERTQGNPAQARAHCEAALAAFRQAGQPQGVADALSQLGAILQHLGEMDQAEQHLTEAVQILREVDSRSMLAFTLVVLGAARHLRGDLESAEPYYLESLALGRELGDHNAIATALTNLGEVKLATGRLADADTLLREALDTYHLLGVRNAVAYCLELLAGISLAEGAFERSATLFGAAARLRELLNAPVESYNRERYDRDLTRARAGCGEEGFDAAWGAGRSMPLEAVVDFATAPLAEAVAVSA